MKMLRTRSVYTHIVRPSTYSGRHNFKWITCVTNFPGFSEFYISLANFFNNFGTFLYVSSLVSFFLFKIVFTFFYPSSALADNAFPPFEATDGGFRFNLPQIYVSIDPDDLWDDVIGLMVEGRPIDESSPVGSSDLETGLSHLANYLLSGADWVRPTQVTVHSPSGKVLADQLAGLSLSGGTSRAYETPSLKLVADAFDDDAKLTYYIEADYPLFLSHVFSYNDLKLRTGSQDQAETNIRSAIMSQLCREAGFPGYLPEERAMFWLNGERYAVVSVQPRYIPSWLARRFNLPDTSQIEVIGTSEMDCMLNYSLLDLFMADLSVTENREKLESRVDMADYLCYCALEILSNNVDWPGNNFKMWRYIGTPQADNPMTDGRYRCLLYDSDLTWLPEGFLTGIFGTDTLNSIMANDVMADGLRGNPSAIGNVLRTKAYRDIFVNLTQELLASVFVPEHLAQIVDEQADLIAADMIATYGWAYWQGRLEVIRLLKESMADTRSRVEGDLKTYFGLEAQIPVFLQASEGVSVTLNDQRVEASWQGVCKPIVASTPHGSSGDWRNQRNEGKKKSSPLPGLSDRPVSENSSVKKNYDHCTFTVYEDTEITFVAQAAPGYRFLHWVVNSAYREGEALTLQMATLADDRIEITAVAIPVSEALIIAEISAKDEGDWIRLYNAGLNPVNLSDYALTDSPSLKKSIAKFPSIVLNRGESVFVDCKNNVSAASMAICSFNLSRGETVYLWDLRSRSLIDSLPVPRMAKGETYGRDPITGQLLFQLPAESQ